MRFPANSPGATDALGRRLAGVLHPGDVITLSGPLGAGKSHLARSVIRAVAEDPAIDVPSPSYTLVNIYKTPRGEIWHADLYRVGCSDEIREIGLADDAGTRILMLEWPERWDDLPARRLDITILPAGGDARAIAVNPVGAGWDATIAALGELP